MLRLENLTCGYGEAVVVHDLCLDLKPGSITGLLGANGAGKSSTLLCIAGHVPALSGRLFLNGEDITRLAVDKRIRRGIALSPEGRRLFKDLTVEENLCIGGMIHPRRHFKADRDFVLSLFPHLGERLQTLAGNLSGGEQQMLAIGRALMARPSLLLIDELSLGLMPKVIDLCYQALGSLRERGVTLLLVEQNTERALEVVDHLSVLESGRKVWEGPPEEARRAPMVVKALLGGTSTDD